MGESSNSGQYQKLPPGWDCKFDQATGNCYYINYFTKAMQLEDPRIRYKQLQNERCSTESIPLQPLHGSPYHVYPSNNLPAMRAFHGPGSAHHAHSSWQHHMSSSPLLSSRGNLEMSPLPFPKLAVTHTPRLGNMSRRSTIQETSFSNHIDTDAVVMKIQNMFPTASETHIRLLLRRYYNREAVVISALQVEKHPVTMPGPFVTPPAQRHLFHSNSAFQMTPPSRRLDIGHLSSIGRSAFGVNGSGTSRTASPLPLPGGRFGSVISMNSSGGRGVADGTLTGCSGFIGSTATAATHHGIGIGGIGGIGGGGVGTYSGYSAMPSSILLHGSPRFGEQWRSSPKPHSSPKMKLRYMKTIFPKADEMLLLDILAGADNNVQKASQTLISMGYVKRDYAPPKPPHHVGLGPEANTSNEELQRRKAADEQIIPLRPKEYTQDEKEAMQQRLKEKYTQIAERIIVMALESVNYAEDRAIQILQIVQNEEDATHGIVARDAAALQQHGLLPATLESIGELDLHNGNHLTITGKAKDAVDNIITVVVEETQNTNPMMSDDKTNAPKSSPSASQATAIDPSNNNINNATTTTTTTAATAALSTSISSTSSTSFMKNTMQAMKRRAFPAINVTTPTTATTQIILSNSPIYGENETAAQTITTTNSFDEIGKEISAQTHHQHHNDENMHENLNKNLADPSTSTSSITKTSSSLKKSTSSSASTSTSSAGAFEPLTIKGLLARLNNRSSTMKRANFVKSSSISTDAYGTTKLLAKLKISSRPRDKFDTLKHSQRLSYDDEHDGVGQQQEFKSLIGRIATMGPNNELSKGPDESLLLADYVTWNGANPDISSGNRNKPTGADPSLLSERAYAAHGRNTELCKGAKRGLAKGSIYAQLTASGNGIVANSKTANIKCN